MFIKSAKEKKHPPCFDFYFSSKFLDLYIFCMNKDSIIETQTKQVSQTIDELKWNEFHHSTTCKFSNMSRVSYGYILRHSKDEQLSFQPH